MPLLSKSLTRWCAHSHTSWWRSLTANPAVPRSAAGKCAAAFVHPCCAVLIPAIVCSGLSLNWLSSSADSIVLPSVLMLGTQPQLQQRVHCRSKVQLCTVPLAKRQVISFLGSLPPSPPSVRHSRRLLFGCSCTTFSWKPVLTVISCPCMAGALHTTRLILINSACGVCTGIAACLCTCLASWAIITGRESPSGAGIL